MLLNYLELSTYEKLKNSIGFFSPQRAQCQKRGAPVGRNSPCPWGSIACGHRGDASPTMSLGHVAGTAPLPSLGLRDKTGKEERLFGVHRCLRKGQQAQAPEPHTMVLVPRLTCSE